MSAAEPMGSDRRARLYGPGGRWTPRQCRRYWHKEMRAVNASEAVDTDIPVAERIKGRPTPRQRKRRAAR